MKKLLSLAVLSASMFAAPLAAHATAYPMGDAAVGFNLTPGVDTYSGPNGTGNKDVDLTAASTQSLTWAGGGVTGQDGYFGVATTSTIGSGLYNVGTSAFSFTIAGYGTFTATSQSIPDTFGGVGPAPGGVPPARYTLNEIFQGTFTPTLAGYAPDSASFNVTFNQNGGAFSGSGTLSTYNIPTPTVPEPSSLLLLGTGLLGSVGAIRRRFKA